MASPRVGRIAGSRPDHKAVGPRPGSKAGGPRPEGKSADTRPERRMTVPAVRAAKRSATQQPLVMLTAYDAPGARVADKAGVDIILVGDSLAMVVLGYEDTLSVTVADMAHHTAAVARVRPAPLVVADMPWMSYHVSAADTVTNAATLIRAGAQAVKLEGGTQRVPMIEAIVSAEIPVMGHIGLTPQSVHAMGGFKVQARHADAAQRLLDDAQNLVAAGCFSIVLEGVPDTVARIVTESIEVPTIGIGAGPHCDGQVLVFHDVLGLEERIVPKFVRRYAELGPAAVDAVKAFAADVRNGAFPDDSESYHLTAAVEDELSGLYGAPAADAAGHTGR